MPIRIEHQAAPGLVGLAAYSSGMGTAREKQRKYAVDLLQESERTRARREEQTQSFKYAQILQGQQQAAQGAVANARIAAQENAAKQRNQWAEDAAAKADERTRWKVGPALDDAPEHADLETKRKLANIKNGIRTIRSDFSYDNVAAREKDQQLRQEHAEIIKNIPARDLAKQATSDWYYVDEKTGETSSERKPGMVPYDIKTKKPAIDQTSAKAEAAAAKAEQTAATAAAKQEQAEKARLQQQYRQEKKTYDTLLNGYVKEEKAGGASDKEAITRAKALMQELGHDPPELPNPDGIPEVDVDGGVAKPPAVPGPGAAAPTPVAPAAVPTPPASPVPVTAVPVATPPAANPYTTASSGAPWEAGTDADTEAVRQRNIANVTGMADALNRAKSQAQQAQRDKTEMSSEDVTIEAPGGQLVRPLTEEDRRKQVASTNRRDQEQELRQQRVSAIAAQRGAARDRRLGKRPVAQPTSGVVQVSTDAEFNRLPSGTVYIGPDGKQRRKR